MNIIFPNLKNKYKISKQNPTYQKKKLHQQNPMILINSLYDLLDFFVFWRLWPVRLWLTSTSIPPHFGYLKAIILDPKKALIVRLKNPRSKAYITCIHVTC